MTSTVGVPGPGGDQLEGCPNRSERLWTGDWRPGGRSDIPNDQELQDSIEQPTRSRAQSGLLPAQASCRRCSS